MLKNRELMGATDPKKADKGTIRADFADSIDANAVHGSDSLENAAIEIALASSPPPNCVALRVPAAVTTAKVNLFDYDRSGLRDLFAQLGENRSVPIG